MAFGSSHVSVLLILTGRAGGVLFFFFQAEDGIRDADVTGVQTCALPICCCSRDLMPAASGTRDRPAATAPGGSSGEGAVMERISRGLRELRGWARAKCRTGLGTGDGAPIRVIRVIRG